MCVAHTSAGKTLVAEYAVALAKSHGTKVVFTSPIKALSNQKYKDFKDIFAPSLVGLSTGDVAIDKDEAFCVVMTTEILRGLLYAQDPMINDLEFVVLDEVHYVNDAERGVVWEEVLLALPPRVKVVMLSATVPNYMEFAQWVGTVRNETVYVQHTTTRPVPLEHSVYFNGKFIPLMSSASTETNFGEWDAIIREKQADKKSGSKKATRGARGRKRPAYQERQRADRAEDQKYTELVRSLETEERLPAVVFSFSKVKCDNRAEKLASGPSLLSSSEAFRVKTFFIKAIQRLDPEDQELPQVLFMQGLLAKGVGVHHSGILPLLKEIVEILFSDGLIKVLVATETFAVGLNMPTKTVVFCETRKFDGNGNRNLTPSEYTQMSGRAGRRGKDDCGHVIIFVKDIATAPWANTLKEIMQEKPLDLTSKFHINYKFVCDLLKRNIDAREVINRSFKEKDVLLYKDRNQEELEKLNAKMSGYSGITGDVMDLCSNIRVFLEINAKSQPPQTNSKNFVLPKFALITDGTNICVPFLILEQRSGELIGIAFSQHVNYPDILKGIHYKKTSCGIRDVIAVFKLAKIRKNLIEMRGDKIDPASIDTLTSTFAQAQKSGFHTYAQIFKVPANDERVTLTTIITSSPQLYNPALSTAWSSAAEILELEEKQKQLQNSISGDTSALQPEIDCRMEILRQFEYVDGQFLTEKGKILSDISSPYDIVISELFFQGYFKELEPEEIAALVSLFVTETRGGLDTENITETLVESVNKLTEIYHTVQEVEDSKKVESLMQDFKLGLMAVVYSWATKKYSFFETVEITDEREGNIVRCLFRTINLLDRLAECAGNLEIHELQEKLKLASESLNRGIVCVPSLYLEPVES